MEVTAPAPEVTTPAPLLSRIKSWQLVWLGISGWIALYSVAIISWGTGSFVIGNAQGGCFATAMTLAGVEARRFQRRSMVPMDPLHWTGSISTEQLNLTLAESLKRQELLVEGLHPYEIGLGFGLRAVKSGRTFIFETARWKEPVIDLVHAKTTEENRSNVRADFAVIVSAGKPDEETQVFVNNHPVKLLAGNELRALFPEETPAEKTMEPIPAPEPVRAS